VTREPFVNRGRITDLITSGRLFEDIGLSPFDSEYDRIQICGSPEMVKDLRHYFISQSFEEGANSKPGHFVVEKAFVDS
jgi:ferredoxin--NADP+ reductase